MDKQKVLEKYVQANEKLYMSMEESEILSQMLANKIMEKHSGVIDDDTIVVGIANGGLMVAKIVAEKLNLPFETLKIRRKNSKIKRYFGNFKSIVKFCSVSLNIPILSTLIKYIINSMNQIEKVDCDENRYKNKKIILIDDCVESGASIRVSHDILQEKNASLIVVGVLTFKNFNKFQETSVINSPIIFLNTKVMHYPWSQNNKQYDDFLKWLSCRNVQIWE
ncbi:Phosphoribosyl transferase domain-containing protein [Desulfomicrobium norvegicum]|uniref:Phosphoribosyl transferase domain-containing protein n=1 Tax=Desulfomicrobium norvegicum (strain DSM 1741 / NCIMB 8310) TaxID=52561 RepID=A0A8G2FEF4_DESNO|nr:phosphoribosyltransferase [Desulfomicrobium norvegicum]SFL76186.1 Phosphoribosyl transferase domain-containing protein [Desulfomicrobium norvegicum]